MSDLDMATDSDLVSILQARGWTVEHEYEQDYRLDRTGPVHFVLRVVLRSPPREPTDSTVREAT
jgi:hypothetical protein